MLHKTRRTSRLTSPAHRRSTDLQEALGLADAPLRIECYDVSHLERHQHRRLDGRVRRRSAAQGPVPHVRRFRETTRRHRLDPPGAHPPARLPRRARRRGRARDIRRGRRSGRAPTTAETSGRRRKFAYRPQPARRRRRPAAGRGGRARPRRCRASTEIALCGIAKRLEEIWTARRGLPGHPASQQRGALPLPARPRRGAPVRDHASAPAAQARHQLRALRDPRARRLRG